MDDVIDEGAQIAQQAIQEVAKADNNWAAIILLVVVLGAIALSVVVVYSLMLARVKRTATRYEEEKQHTQDIKASADERLLRVQVQHEREMRFREDMNDRYDETLNKVNSTMGGVVEIIRQANVIHEGTRQTLQRNNELLERFAPKPMPRHSTPRKPTEGSD